MPSSSKYSLSPSVATAAAMRCTAGCTMLSRKGAKAGRPALLNTQVNERSNGTLMSPPAAAICDVSYAAAAAACANCVQRCTSDGIMTWVHAVSWIKKQNKTKQQWHKNQRAWPHRCSCRNAAAHRELLRGIQSYKKIPTVVGLDAECEDVGKIRQNLFNVAGARECPAALDDGGNGRDGALANLRNTCYNLTAVYNKVGVLNIDVNGN